MDELAYQHHHGRLRVADSVAIVSVIVTGIVARAIAAIAARGQVNLTSRVTLAKEYRDVLDEGAGKLAKLTRASGHVVALWERGVKTILLKHNVNYRFAIRLLTAYGRICIRFGEGSEVAQTYARAIAQIDRHLEPPGNYRKGGECQQWSQN